MLWIFLNAAMTIMFIMFMFRVYDDYIESRALMLARQCLYKMTLAGENADVRLFQECNELLKIADSHETSRIQTMLWSSSAIIVVCGCGWAIPLMSGIATFVSSLMWALVYGGLIKMAYVKIPGLTKWNDLLRSKGFKV